MYCIDGKFPCFFFLKVLEGLLKVTCDWKEDVRHFVHFKVNTHQVSCSSLYIVSVFLYICVFACAGTNPARGLVSTVHIGIWCTHHKNKAVHGFALNYTRNPPPPISFCTTVGIILHGMGTKKKNQSRHINLPIYPWLSPAYLSIKSIKRH